MTSLSDALLADAVRDHVCLRQPIVDPHRRVVGYEVFVAGPGAAVDPTVSARVLLQAFTGVELDALSAARPVFVTIAPALLATIDLLPVAPDRVVLQVDASQPLDDDVRAAIARQSQLGFVFAATGVTHPAQLANLPQASLVRIDIAGCSPTEVLQVLRAFDGCGLPVHARGVDDLRAYDACVAALCAGLQGTFWTLPSCGDAGADLGALSSATELLDPHADLEQLEQVVTRDLALTYGLLRYANSAFFARRTEIATVRQACMTLGERMTRRWAMIVALGAAASDGDPALMGDALLRARTLELLAADLPGLAPELAFTVGLLSLTPGLIGAPMETVVAGLSLPAEVEDALLGGRPPYGALLEQTVAFLQGAPGVRPERIAPAYAQALAWVAEVSPALAPTRGPAPVAAP